MTADEAFMARLDETVSRAGGPSRVRSLTGFSLTAIDNYRSGKSEPNRSKLIALAKAGHVRVQWLVTGEGPVERNGGSEIDRSSALTDSRGALADGEALADYTLVPKYEVRASAGTGAVIASERIVDHLAFKNAWLQSLGIAPRHLLLIEAVGDSMMPRIADGDLLLIDTSLSSVQQNAIYVIRLDNDLVVKRIQRKLDGSLTVMSDNPAYSPELVPANEATSLSVIGRVVWVGGRV